MKNVGRQLIWIAILVVSAGASALDNPAQMNFDGVLLNGSNAPITAPTSVKFQIYNPAADCLLYEETQTVTPDANGAFSAIIGVPANRASAGVDGGLPWKTVFSNKGGALRAAASPGCSPGYTPASTDGRKLKVTVGGNVLSPDFVISSTPFATTADTLQGYQPADFLSNLGGSLTGFLKMDSQNQIRFADAGNTNYIALSAPASIGGNYSFTLPASYGSNGQVLTSNGAGGLSWTTVGGGGLPLSGGTMTGAIAMGGNNITATGHITMNAQTTLNLGTYTAAQETALVAGLSAADKGKTWFNSTSNTMMYYDGATAQTVSAGAGINALTGDVTASGAGSVAATIAANAVTTGKIANDAVTSAKLNSAGVAINRLLITDPTTGTQVQYADACAINEVLKWSASGWVCSADSNTDAVSSVAGKTGAVTLVAGDISGLGTAATMSYGTGANQLLLLDGTGRVPAGNLPVNAILNGGNSNGSALFIGTSDNNGLNLITNATARLVISLGGNVGIGSSTPTSALDVLAGGTPTELAKFTGNNAAGTGLKILNTNSVNAYSNVQFWSGAAEQWEMGGSASDFYIYDAMAGQNRITISNTGNVGVGTTTPSDLLQVAGAAATSTGARISVLNPDSTTVSDKAELKVLNYSGATGSASSLSLYTGRGSLATPTAVQSGDILGTIVAAGYTGSGFLPGAKIDFRADQVWTGSTTGSSIAFSTAQNGFASVTERMRIDNNGNVGIGTSFPAVTLDMGMKTDAMILPKGTTPQQPGGPSGMIRYNTTVNDIEFYNGSAWKGISQPKVIAYAGNYVDSAVSTLTTYYTTVSGPSTINGGTPSTTDYAARTRNVVTRGGNLANLFVNLSQAPGSNWQFVVRVNGVDSALTCTITSAALTCNDMGNQVPVNAGDEVGLKIITGSSGAAARATWALELISP